MIYQNTALHIAAKGGHVPAVKLLLTRGADIVLNKNDTSFLHEALQNGRKDVVNAVIDSDRYINTMVCSIEKKDQLNTFVNQCCFVNKRTL